MGSEQSSQGNSKNKQDGKSKPAIRREKTMPASATPDEEERCVSPELSVCSDSDLPYISFTVNRPIGGKISRCIMMLMSIGRKDFNNSSGPDSKQPHHIVTYKADG